MIRAFIAVELPEEVKSQVEAFQNRLRPSGADVSWVKDQNLHLTLKFLGDIEESTISSLKERLGPAVQPHQVFSLRLEGIGAFPSTTSPRVLWLGIGDGKETLLALASSVEKVCSDLGLPKEERPFSAHLTIGRVRSRDRLAALVKQLQTAEFQGSSPAPVNHLTLFQSTLSPHGPTYTPLAHLCLG